MSLSTRLITGAVGLAAATFYRVERTGQAIPGGPVLVIANHPNSLLDPLMLFHTAGRPTRPLAKAPLFKHPLIGPVLRQFGGLPVFRAQDDPLLMDRNEETFRHAIAVLHRGEAVQIYPEGRSHSEPALAPLRTGAARIALRAEADAGWGLGLQVVPVGLTYVRKPFYRGRALASIGQPFTLAEYRAEYEADPVAAVRRLTAVMAARLEELTLNLSTLEDRELIEVAERLYAREKRLAEWREPDELRRRLPRLQQFAAGLAWLRAHDPARHARLAAAVRRYRRRLAAFGAVEGDVPPRYRAGPVLRYTLRQGAVLAMGLPPAALGVFFWFLPYLAPRLVVRIIRLEEDTLATYKLSTAVLALPAALAGWIALAAWRFGAGAAVAAAVALPALGWFAHHWTSRWDRVREDARLFFRVLRHPRHQGRLAEERRRLVAEFDAVAAQIEAAAENAARPLPAPAG